MKKYLKLLVFPILFLIVQFSVIFIFTLIFNSNTSFEINSIEYNQGLSIFLNNYKLLITIITALIMFPIVIKKIDKPKEVPSDIPILILLGISFAIAFNLLLYSLNLIFDFTNLFNDTNNNLLITIVCSGLIGPILEELIFRGIIYKKLKDITKPRKAILISGLIFGLFHGNVIQFIYAFLFNIILSKSYDKNNNILSPIVVHISANIIVTLALFIIRKLHILSSIFVFIICLIIFIIIMYKYFSDGQNKNVNNC